MIDQQEWDDAQVGDMIPVAVEMLHTAMGMSPRYMSLAKVNVMAISKDLSGVFGTNGYLFSIDLSSQSVPQDIREAFENLLRLIEARNENPNPNE